MDPATTPATLVILDGALGDAPAVFREAVAYLARRFERVAPLDPSSLPDDPGAAIEALDRWAGEGAANWRQELIRFYEAHAPVLLRTDADLNARIRAAVKTGIVLAVASPLPGEAAELFVGHLGLRRAIAHVAGGPTAVEDARAALGDTSAPVVATRSELDARLG
jgi:hypothetical protein